MAEEINIEDIDNIIEELIVDIDPQKSGWAGTPEPVMDYKTQLKLAQLAGTKAHEELEAVKDAADRLAEEKKTLEINNEKIIPRDKVMSANQLLTEMGYANGLQDAAPNSEYDFLTYQNII